MPARAPYGVPIRPRRGPATVRLGRRGDAITTAKAAIQIAKETGADYSATTEALKEMEKR